MAANGVAGAAVEACSGVVGVALWRHATLCVGGGAGVADFRLRRRERDDDDDDEDWSSIHFK